MKNMLKKIHTLLEKLKKGLTQDLKKSMNTLIKQVLKLKEAFWNTSVQYHVIMMWSLEKLYQKLTRK